MARWGQVCQCAGWVIKARSKRRRAKKERRGHTKKKNSKGGSSWIISQAFCEMISMHDDEHIYVYAV